MSLAKRGRQADTHFYKGAPRRSLTGTTSTPPANRPRRNRQAQLQPINAYLPQAIKEEKRCPSCGALSGPWYRPSQPPFFCPGRSEWNFEECPQFLARRDSIYLRSIPEFCERCRVINMVKELTRLEQEELERLKREKKREDEVRVKREREEAIKKRESEEKDAIKKRQSEEKDVKLEWDSKGFLSDDEKNYKF